MGEGPHFGAIPGKTEKATVGAGDKLQGREREDNQQRRQCICEAPSRRAKGQITWKLLEHRLPPLPLLFP